MINFQNVISAFSAEPKGSKYAGNQKCEDYYWGVLTQGNVEQNPRIEGTTFSQARLRFDNVIVIIAESPHTREYTFENGRCTGYNSPLHRCDKRIKRYFSKNAKKWFDNDLD